MYLRKILIVFCLIFANLAHATSLKVVGGTTVTTAPTWMTALYITVTENNQSTTYFCGGSLIESQWVLTAAHCVDDYDDGATISINAIIGKSDTSTWTTSDYVAVDKYYVNGNWNKDSTNMEGDIALLHLATAQTAGTVSLASATAYESLADGDSMTVYGWGETDAGTTSSNASISSTLQTATVSYWYEPSSSDYTKYIAEFPDDLLTKNSDTDTCFGDSGGPLLYNNVLYGVTSFGTTDTCATGNPSGYTNVGLFRSWIDSTISGYSSSTSSDDDDSSGGGGGSLDWSFILLLPLAWLCRRALFRV